jgi:DNA-binding NarL/FixJ family response regulator
MIGTNEPSLAGSPSACPHRVRDPSRRGALKSGKLTVAEESLLPYVVAGLSNKEIAHATGKAQGTIKCQVSSMLRKAGVPSRTRFVAEFYQRLLARSRME